MKFTGASLPSPDLLDIPTCKGEDTTNAVGDYKSIWDFFNRFNQPPILLPHVTFGKTLEKLAFGPAVEAAFKLPFDPLRKSGDEEELIVIHYAGHGLSQDNIKKDLKTEEREELPVPRMPNLCQDYFTGADEYLEPGELKEGALFLHHRGYSDLRGLLRPFIAALEYEKEQPRKNKHLLIVVDSCYSGVFAEDLQKMISNGELKRWLDNGCSITVQTFSGHDEPTFGGYFTPCFIQLNDPGCLKKLRKKWNSLGPQTKEFLEDVVDDLPTPRLVTTRPNNGDLVLKIPAGESSITLFNDANFFKYCFIKLKNNGVSAPRTLSRSERQRFLEQENYNVIDFKLRRFQGVGPRRGTPMGLFLVKNPADPNKAVCVHVHYNIFYTPKKFKLFEHEKIDGVNELADSTDSVLYDANDAQRLISQCKEFVKQSKGFHSDAEFETWWRNVNNWAMKGLGFCKKFRKQLRTAYIRNALLEARKIKE